MRVNFFRILFLSYLILLVIFSIIPSNKNSEGLSSYFLSNTGAFLHCIAYFVCTYLAYVSFNKKLFKTLLFVLLLSSLLEMIQYLIPYRTFNPLDIAANLAGIIIFIFIMIIWTRITGSRKSLESRIWDC